MRRKRKRRQPLPFDSQRQEMIDLCVRAVFQLTAILGAAGRRQAQARRSGTDRVRRQNWRMN